MSDKIVWILVMIVLGMMLGMNARCEVCVGEDYFHKMIKDEKGNCIELYKSIDRWWHDGKCKAMRIVRVEPCNDSTDVWTLLDKVEIRTVKEDKWKSLYTSLP